MVGKPGKGRREVNLGRDGATPGRKADGDPFARKISDWHAVQQPFSEHSPSSGSEAAEASADAWCS